MMTNTTTKVTITSSAIVLPTKKQSSLHDGGTETGTVGHGSIVELGGHVVLVDDDNDDDGDGDDELVEAGISQFLAGNIMQAN